MNIETFLAQESRNKAQDVADKKSDDDLTNINSKHHGEADVEIKENEETISDSNIVMVGRSQY